MISSDIDVVDSQHVEKTRLEDFVRYCSFAVSNRGSEEYKSLYEHLFKTFVESNVEENGAIRRNQFDVLIEDAAKAPPILVWVPVLSRLSQLTWTRLLPVISFSWRWTHSAVDLSASVTS